MTKRADDKVKELKSGGAALAVRAVNSTRQEADAISATLLLGAAGALDATARLTASHTVRALQRFRDTKGHEALGFSNFKEFLNKSPYAPMSYDQFNDREKLLENEGDVVFNLLSTMRVPAYARKQLANGTVQIEGEEVVIAGERIPADDKPRILEVIKTLADTMNAQARKLEQGKADNAKWKEEAKKAKRNTSRRADTPAHDQALMDVLVAMGRLAEEASKLSEDESAEVRDEDMRLISEQWERIRAAHRFPDATPVAPPSSPSIFNTEDLSDLEDM